MKILLISNMYPNKKNPSYGVFVRNTEKILLEEGFEVDKVVFFKQQSMWKKLFLYLYYYIKIIVIGFFKEYDVIYVHYAAHNSIPLNILNRIKDVKIFTNVHGSDIVPEVHSQEKYQKHVYKLLHHSYRIITPSHYYKELVKQKYKLEEDKIKVFPSGGVDFTVFHEIDRSVAIEKLNLDVNVRYIGYVGRIDVQKGWNIFLHALKTVNEENGFENIKGLVVGDGKELDMFHTLIEEYGLHEKVVHFNLMSQQDLKYVYNAIDLFCFPTMRKGESLGLVGLEAMACGTPIIGSKIGGILDYTINNENGFLFNTGESTDLKNKIVTYFCLNDSMKKVLSNNAMKTAEKYEVESITSVLVGIFN